MNDPHDTRSALLTAARRLFARHGYDGTSIKAITSMARANLGAVTYHFATKEKLYHAVLRSLAEPLLAKVFQAGSAEGVPLERLEAVVRAFYGYLADHREMPALMLSELSLRHRVPPPIRETMAGVLGVVAGLVRDGQADGSICAGDPALMSVSIMSQPAYVILMETPLREVAGFDAREPEARRRLLDHIVAYTRRGLTAERRSL